VADLTKRFFDALNGRKLTEAEVERVITLTDWARNTNRSDVISHVLVDRAGGPEIAKTDEVYLGARFGQPDIQTAGGKCLEYVSERYLTDASGTATEDADEGAEASERVEERVARHEVLPEQWGNFFRSLKTAVRQTSVRHSLLWKRERVASLRPWEQALREWLGCNPPARRSGWHSLQLPYGLGTLDNTHFVIADLDLSDEWAKALENIDQAAHVEAARAFAALLGLDAEAALAQFGQLECYYI